MLTAERLRELLHYDPETGAFTWRVCFRNQVSAGDTVGAGRKKDGYRSVQIDGRKYKAHRLAWLYTTGEWPERQIDHRNLCKGDNHRTNLRQANSAQNQQNTPIDGRNSSGFKGVSHDRWGRRRKQWAARICANGRQVSLGYFETQEAAAKAYAAAAERLHGEFARPCCA